jgi:hypothetical protein
VGGHSLRRCDRISRAEAPAFFTLSATILMLLLLLLVLSFLPLAPPIISVFVVGFILC